jgi:hypothetical protein
MCCVRGRCPCWPRAEPFDDAEMDLLSAVFQFVALSNFWNANELHECWVKIQARSLAVRPSRRAYVLSTCIWTSPWTTFDLTLLSYVRYERAKMQWLLDQGVCPNMLGARCRRPATSGWSAGPVHPGRPCRKDMFVAAEDVFISNGGDLLLLSGGYPVHHGHAYFNLLSVCHLSLLQIQWRAWHGRASRRLWTVLAT